MPLATEEPQLATLQQDLWTLYGRPSVPELHAETTALLCIDMQYLDAHRDYGLGIKASARGIPDFLDYYWDRVENMVIPNMARLQGVARSKGIEVVHVRVASLTRDGRDSTKRYKRMGLVSQSHTKDAEILPDLAPLEDELVISKVTSSPFNSTSIDRVLRNIGIENVVIAGVVTNGCVESTARSAAEQDYGVIVVDDATATMAPILHEASLLSMSYKDAAILPTADVCDLFAKLDDAPPRRDAAAPKDNSL